MSRIVRVALIGLAIGLAQAAVAQKSLPNPLIAPPKRGAPMEGSPEGANGAMPAGAPKAAADTPTAAETGVTSEVLNRLSGLYVSAIVGDVAVLRSGAASSASSASPAGAGGQSGAQSGGGGGSGRGSVYFVRDAEAFQLFDRFRILPRVQDATVVLYLLTEGANDPAKRPQVVFRATLDSSHSAPYVPPKLESSGGGDGSAYQGLIQTGVGGGGTKPGTTTPGGGAPK